MANTIQIKHGSSVPTTSNLAPFELGYVKDGALYINNDGTIAQLTDPKTIGIIDANNRLKIPSITAVSSGTNLDKFLVCNSSGVVYYKTAENALIELKALPLAGGTVTGATSFNGSLTANGALIVKKDISYGDSKPNDSDGQLGQLFFVLVEEE